VHGIGGGRSVFAAHVGNDTGGKPTSVVITGRVVVVTGASSGTGEATARLAHERGARVVAVAGRRDRLEALVSALPGTSPWRSM
jgi:NADPH:quinone reductase-like Zn-dependent oxidoreductase